MAAAPVTKSLSPAYPDPAPNVIANRVAYLTSGDFVPSDVIGYTAGLSYSGVTSNVVAKACADLASILPRLEWALCAAADLNARSLTSTTSPALLPEGTADRTPRTVTLAQLKTAISAMITDKNAASAAIDAARTALP